MRNEQARQRKMDAFSNQALIDPQGQSVWAEALPVVDEAIDALPDLVMELRHTVKEVMPEAGWTQQRLMAWPDHENVFTIPAEHQRFNTMQITPSAPGSDGAIFLEAKLGLGHAAQPGMRVVNLNVQYGY